MSDVNMLSTNPLELRANRSLLKYAVQKQITCPRTGQVLDVRTAVAVTVKNSKGGESTFAMVGTEWDKIANHIQHLAVEQKCTVEVLDGRELFRR